ncbi:MAG: hypothetical protein EA356_14930 [Geminicoccaceae bacterium]|nr:MAG: hypothetical protein EA356_14930 [Geminicoccaceae bacterium]
MKELIAAAFPGNRDALFAVQILLADDDVARAAEAGDQEAAAQGLAYLRSFVARWDLDRDADRGRKLIERTRRGGRKGAAVRRNEAEPKRGQIAALVAELTPREGLKAAKYAAMERFGVSLSTVERAVKKSTVTS